MKKLLLLFYILSLVCLTGFSQNTNLTNFVNQATTQKVVYITKTGKKYHRSSCRHLSKSKIEIDKSKATTLGYTPCAVCKP